jgi:transcription termination factor Rho
MNKEKIIQPPPFRKGPGKETPIKKPIKKKIIKISKLQRMNIEELNKYAKNLGLQNLGSLPKSQVVFEVVKAISMHPNEMLYCEGVLEILPDGFGFLRSPNYNYLPSAEDIYVSPSQIRRYHLCKGDSLYGSIRSPKEKEKYFALLKVEKINDRTPEGMRERVLFENLTPLYPEKRLIMETSKEKTTTRVLDLASPIGKGQRAMIVSPPKSGKTVLLQD